MSVFSALMLARSLHRLHADIKATALCYGVQNSADLFGKVLDQWKMAETSTEAAGHAAALACTLEHRLLSK